jgi:hypothetical protein
MDPIADAVARHVLSGKPWGASNYVGVVPVRGADRYWQQASRDVHAFIVGHHAYEKELFAWLDKGNEWCNSPERTPAEVINHFNQVRDSFETWAADAERWAAAYPGVLIQRPHHVFNFDTTESLMQYSDYCRLTAEGWADICATRIHAEEEKGQL